MIIANEECELIALCDVESYGALSLNSYKVPFFTSLPDLLDSELTFDVLNVCTPNGFHAEHALAGLDANKHVVIEKPMTLSKASAIKIKEKAELNNKQVFCVMQNRYSPPVAWLKSIVSENKLGNIYLVQIDCYWNRDDRYYLPNGKKHAWHGDKKNDGGVLFTQFSHFIDLLYWLFGDVKNIQARFKDFAHTHSTDFEDSGTVSFDFEKGGMGIINYSTAVFDKNLESSIKILGSTGTVKIGGQYMNELEYCNIDNYSAPTLEEANPANDYGSYKGSANNHPFVFENVVKVLKGKTKMTTNIDEGIKVVEIIENIYKLRP